MLSLRCTGRIITAIIIALASTNVLGQSQEKLDSLLKVWNDPAAPDTGRINAMTEYCWIYTNINPDSSIAQAQRLIAFCQQHNNVKNQANAMNTIGTAYFLKGQKADALQWLEKSLSIKEAIHDTRGAAQTLNNLGRILNDMGMLNEALDCYLRCVRLKESIGYQKGLAATFQNIGLLYASLKDSGKARLYYEKADSLYTVTEDKLNRGLLYTNMASLDADEGNYASAFGMLEKSERLFTELMNQKELTRLKNIRANFLYKSGDYAGALRVYESVLEENTALGYKTGVASAWHNIALSHGKLGNLSEAKRTETIAVNLFRELQERHYMIEAYEGLANACIGLGQYKEATEYYIKLDELKDSLYEDNSARNIAQTESRFAL